MTAPQPPGWQDGQPQDQAPLSWKDQDELARLRKENAELNKQLDVHQVWWPAQPLPESLEPMRADLEARWQAEVHLQTREMARKQAAQRALNAEGRQPVVLVPAADVRKRQPPPELVEGLIPSTGIGVFFGDTGTYKSFLVLNLLLCVGARSAAFLGHMVGGPGLGVYVMGEGQHDAGVRLDAAVSANLAFTDENLTYIEQAFPLSDEAAVDEVTARCRELAERTDQLVRLVVFDSFADFYGAGDSENSSTDMQRLIAGMKRISAELGCAVMANAHTGHGGKDEDGGDRPPPQRLRGSSRFRQAWDFELMATGTLLRPTKNRYGLLAPAMRYGVRPHAGTLVIDGQCGTPGPEAAAPEPEWPHPVTAEQVDQVTAAVTRTPGMTMTQVTKAARIRKGDCGIALLKAQEIGAVVNTGTRSSPRYKPGPVMEWARDAGWLGS